MYLRPILGFGAAGAGLNIEKGVVSIHLTAEHALEFEFAHVRFESSGLALDIARGGLIVLELCELEQRSSVAQLRADAIELLELRGQPRALASELLRPSAVAPYRGFLELAADFLEALFLAIVLKETPSRRWFSPRDL
jgi:hypothetical protein